MTESSPTARFADAFELDPSETAGVTPKAFETERRKRGWSSAAAKLFPKPALASRPT
jgi:hypothetical protein